MITIGQKLIKKLDWNWLTYEKQKGFFRQLKWTLTGCVFIFHQITHAQCSGGSNGGALSPAPTSSYQTMNTTSGNYYTFVVPSGSCYDTYDFSFCPANGSNATHDSQITILDNTGTYVGSAYSDDFCGLQSHVTWTPSSAGTYRVLVNNYPCTTGSTATIAYKKTTPPNMTYTSSTVVDLGASANVEICDYSSKMSRVEIVTSGSCSAMSLTQLLVDMTGTAPTSTVNRVHVYYTGTSSTFTAINEFVMGGMAPATSIAFSSSQTLSAGTNYFWIVYDFSNTGTVGNTIGADMPASSITVGGIARTPTATPNCLKTYIACVAYPSNSTLFLKSTTSTNTTTQGAAVNSWGSTGSVAITVTQATGANQPIYHTGAITNKFNYNPYIQFDGSNDYLVSTGTYDLGNGTAGGAGFSVFGIMSFTSGVVGLDWNGTNGKAKIKGDGISALNDATTSTGTNNQVYNVTTTQGFMTSIRGKQSGVSGEYNGKALTTASNNNPSSTKRLALACNTELGEYLSGGIAEFIIYPSVLSNANNLKVMSYLALKYGITLGTTSLVSNYLSTDGSIIYTGTSSYHNNVIGIGRDDASTLYQKQSHNYDDSVRIYKGTLATTNGGNAATFAADKSFVIMGANTGKLCQTAAVAAEIPASCLPYSRIAREWKVTKTNMAESFNLDIKLAACANPAGVIVNDLTLLVDDDGNFANGGTSCYQNGDGTGIVFTYSNPTITITGISNTHIPNNSTYFITIGSMSIITTLPIELTKFDAQLNSKRTVDVTWTTETEINNDYFIVEKSVNLQTWEQVAQLNGAGNSNQTLDYYIVDPSPIINMNYYRLKQVDYDGETSLSEIRAVNLEVMESVSIYPNPSNSNFIIQNKNIENKTVKLVNAIGQEVTLNPIAVSKDFIQYSTNGLVEGVYTLMVIEENKVESYKLVIIG